MAKSVQDKKVAILATDGFEQSELEVPLKALKDAGAKTSIVSLKPGKIRGWKAKDWGDEVTVDIEIASADAADFDALVLPGGVMNPDKLRIDAKAVAFVKAFIDAAKPVAAICHGPWTLVEANVVRGRTLTSWPSLRSDIVNAGGEWVDEEVVTDRGLVTSRKPDDLKAFCAKMLEEIAEGSHRRAPQARQQPGTTARH